MPAPSYTARQTPAGKRLKSGWKCVVTLAADPNIEFFEREVKPLGLSVGLLDDTTQHNVRFETQSTTGLVKSNNMELTVEYDPAVRVSILAALGRHDTISILYPNLDTDSFYGAVIEWDPQPLKRDEKPTARVVIAHLAQDSACVEYGPTFVAGPGTSTC
jgi:hypothetical protein